MALSLGSGREREGSVIPEPAKTRALISMAISASVRGDSPVS